MPPATIIGSTSIPPTSWLVVCSIISAVSWRLISSQASGSRTGAR